MLKKDSLLCLVLTQMSLSPIPIQRIDHDPSFICTFLWSLVELDKAVVLVWLDCLVFCEFGFSVFALWCPLATPAILLGFLLPWAWGISSRLLQQSAAIAPYLGLGVSPHHRPSWPSVWDSSSRPSCARAATAPGKSSLHSPGLGCGLLRPAAAPGLGLKVYRWIKKW